MAAPFFCMKSDVIWHNSDNIGILYGNSIKNIILK